MAPLTKYQLSLHAEKLKKGFFGRRPMPYAIVSLDNESKTLGKTEISDQQSPDWCTLMKLEFSAAIHLPFVVAIYDGNPRGRNSLLAKAEFEATEVYNSAGHMQMKVDRNGARIFADLHESVQGSFQGFIRLHFRGLDIKNVEPGLLGLGRSDPFFEIAKKNSDHAAGIVRWNTVYRSEHINDHLNPFWEPFSLSLEDLCYCDLNWQLKVAVYDWEQDGQHKMIGEFECTAQKLIDRISVKGNADREQAFELNLEEKATLKGLLCVLTAELNLEESSPTGISP